MELKEGLELISKVCREAEDCDACPFNANTKGAVYCTLDNIGDGKNINIICKVAERMKKQEEKAMTIKELYEWALKHNVEDKELYAINENGNYKTVTEETLTKLNDGVLIDSGGKQ